VYALAAQDQIPKWTARLVPSQTLETELRVDRFCRWTDVDIGKVREGALQASGRIQVQPSASQGALLFRLAGIVPLSLGLRFDDQGSDTSLFAGHGWLEKNLAPLAKAAARKHAAHCAPEPSSCY
jgi:hypothetical protein